MSPKILSIAAAAIVLAGFLAWKLFPGPERAVAARFEQLAAIMEKKSGETTIAAGLKMAELQKLFADPTQVIAPYGIDGSYTPREIAQRAFAMRSKAEHASAEFSSFEIEFPEPDIARVGASVKISGADVGDASSEKMRVIATLSMRDGAWLFERFELIGRR